MGIELKKWIKRFVLASAATAAITTASAAGWIYHKYDEAVTNIPAWTNVENIESILTRDSIVLDKNGQRMALLSGKKDAHREYANFSKIPKNLTNAIVAAEDKNFWKTDSGVDYLALGKAVARGVIKKVRGGRITSGASGLEMQLVKMLNNMDKGRGFAAKLRYKGEQIYRTWQLREALKQKFGDRQAKERALEFYANSIFVAAPDTYGFTHGARYFFGKKIEDLNLIESAYLAGLVQSPSRYNPVFKRGKRKEKSVKKAIWRTGYVIEQMRTNGLISFNEYTGAKFALKTSGIPFKPTKVVHANNSLVDYVVKELGNLNLDDGIVKKGVHIKTTIDSQQQGTLHYGVRHQLSEISFRLDGFKPVAGNPSSSFPNQHNFYKAKIIKINDDEKNPTINVKFGDTDAIVDQKGVMRLVRALNDHDKGRKGRKIKKGDVKRVLHQFKPGNIIYTSVREMSPKGPILDVEQKPAMEGAYVHVSPTGSIEGMVGSYTNFDLNHSVRPHFPGSTLKPLLYAFAFTKGWDPLDTVNDLERRFQVGNNYWIPLNSHHSGNVDTTLYMAGVHSSNIATAEIFFSLSKNLSSEEFKSMAEKYDLAQRIDEDEKTFAKRMLDTYGLRLTESVKQRIAYGKAREIVARKILFQGYDAESQALVRNLPMSASNEVQTKLKRIKRKAWRSHDKKILEDMVQRSKHDFQHFSQLAYQLNDRDGFFYLSYDGKNFKPSFSERYPDSGIEIKSSNLYSVERNHKLPELLSKGKPKNFVKSDITIEGVPYLTLFELSQKYDASIPGEGGFFSIFNSPYNRMASAKQLLNSQQQAHLSGIDDFSLMHLISMVKPLLDDFENIEAGRTPTKGEFYLHVENDNLKPAYSTRTVGENGLLEKRKVTLADILGLSNNSNNHNNHGVKNDFTKNIYLNGVLPALVVSELTEQLEAAEPTLYDHPDLRTIVHAKAFKEFLVNLGIKRAAKWKDAPANILGAETVTPLELSTAYSALLTGKKCEPHVIDEIWSDGKLVYKHQPRCVPISGLTQDHRNHIMQILEGTNRFGTASFLGKFGTNEEYKGLINIGGKAIPTGGKTGTSGKNESLTYVFVTPPGISSTTLPEEMHVRTGWIGYRGGVKQTPFIKRNIKMWGSDAAKMVGRIYQQQLDNPSNSWKITFDNHTWIKYKTTQTPEFLDATSGKKIDPLEVKTPVCAMIPSFISYEKCLPGISYTDKPIVSVLTSH